MIFRESSYSIHSDQAFLCYIMFYITEATVAEVMYVYIHVDICR